MKDRLCTVSIQALALLITCTIGCTQLRAESPDTESTQDPLGTVEVVHVTDDPAQECPLTPETFQARIPDARWLESNDPILEEWHFVPMCQGTLEASSGTWDLIVFLGGLGRIQRESDDEPRHFLIDME